MNHEQRLVTQFYTAFQKLNWEEMSACYHPEATFADEVFELAGKDEITGMWGMLCERAQEFDLQFSDVSASSDAGRAKWEAIYRFSATGRVVHNRIEAEFVFQDGLIITHTDRFNFWRWSQMAFGIPGYALGWTSFFRKKVQDKAGLNLKSFVKRNA
ncbi:MAG: nuclear transport factor 2 family protein [Bacteroidota bacterium]